MEIAVKHLCKSFGGRTVLRDLTFTAGPGIRPSWRSGTGKTTLLRILLGLERPDSGTVEVGATVKIGHFSQEGRELDLNQRVYDLSTTSPMRSGPMRAPSPPTR